MKNSYINYNKSFIPRPWKIYKMSQKKHGKKETTLKSSLLRTSIEFPNFIGQNKVTSVTVITRKLWNMNKYFQTQFMTLNSTVNMCVLKRGTTMCFCTEIAHFLTVCNQNINKQIFGSRRQNIFILPFQVGIAI